MAFSGHMMRITIRLALIFSVMLALALMIGQEARLFSVLALLIILLALIAELFYRINRTNRIIMSLLEAIRSEDYNKNIHDRVTGLGYRQLADSAQTIISAISSARIEKETQYLYLQTILQHIHTAVITLDEAGEPELVNPLALNILGILNSRKPSWKIIRKSSPVFANTVNSMGESGRQMINLSGTPTGRQLLILLNTGKIGGKRVKIITFQDIEPEIEQKEMESWQTISRIMAHEIMNSLTPLSSLTETGIMMLEDKGETIKKEALSQNTIDNLYTALNTISARNKALTKFIGSYRQFSRLPDPEKQKIRICDLLNEISELHRSRCEQEGINCSIQTGPENLVVMADDAQLKQVLINLIKNALEALTDVPQPQLDIRVKRILDTVSVEITDNGSGISPETLEKIFVPFYSTKSYGSGIGLSLSRQIIRNHGGQIFVHSKPGEGSVFTLSLPLL